MKLHVRSLDDLRMLTGAVLATLQRSGQPDTAVLGAEPAEIEEMDPLLEDILKQAESAGGQAFDLELGDAETERLVTAIEHQMERAADVGDLFEVGEFQAVLRQLGRG